MITEININMVNSGKNIENRVLARVERLLSTAKKEVYCAFGRVVTLVMEFENGEVFSESYVAEKGTIVDIKKAEQTCWFRIRSKMIERERYLVRNVSSFLGDIVKTGVDV